MDDLIRRQDAIDAMLEAYEDLDAEWIIKRLPSAQQWIPCSERLPDQNVAEIESEYKKWEGERKMKYKIKVGNKYLVGESVSETLKGTVCGDTTAVYSRFVGEMSAYDFCDNIEDADVKDAVTACDYVRGIMERQNCGFYPGEIKLIDATAEETVVHCKREENANFIAMILDADADGKVWALDFYDNHIEPPKEEE